MSRLNYLWQIVGGGGSGGRMAVYVDGNNEYRGEYHTSGGQGYLEDGSSGTTFIKSPNSEKIMEKSLYIDNKGGKPLSELIADKTKDSAHTYIVTSANDTNDDMYFDHVHINGVGHLALRNTTATDVEIRIGKLHGDGSGMLHASVDQHLVVEDSDTPMPAAFRVYDKATLQLPEGK